MTDTLRLTILGCGSSPGVPRINGDWGACDPSEPRNRRTRCAALVERISAAGRTVVAIDCGPDFREQMLTAEVHHLDAVLVTHPHADHIHGVDDIRGFYLDTHRLVDLFADRDTFERLFEAFGYCFRTPAGSAYPPILRHREIWPETAFTVEGAGGPIEIEPFRQIHGRIHSLGFRIGPFAYCSDVSDFPAEAQARIAGAELLVIGALQHKTHPSHLSLAQALGWIDRLSVGRALLTHMHTPLDYATLCRDLPAHIRPAHDGLQIEFPLN
ncbi:MBL fold metallo-hydrolase [Aureimonas pseudogalii]|uniref:Phosphoribosyl 1,2-cyclic phosphate phosphodiesterase n=1 Tax=Aureimonas pseudogalii TaxID=1744844 RepID=A0A7W6H8I7_9HYPH|nr:MBL fold metallo-hydrolase [Aureimonas pseudogalii]MBB4000584.1 phosphoribosyl 1,2-cyclic phosphate phosphodiesterase [Aureimonas pseudogalii]